MNISKITSNYQLTIPHEVRTRLHINKGDVIEFDIKKDTAILHKVPNVDIEYVKALQTTLSEWRSPQDDELFQDL